MHLVELHAQVGNAGPFFFAGFQVEQKCIAVGLDAAQLVQFGVQAIGDHIAVAHQRRRLFEQSQVQQFGAVCGRSQPTGHAGQQGAWLGLKRLQLRRQRSRTRQRVAQGHQLARAHLAQRRAGGDALHVACAFELFAQAAPDPCAAVAAQNGLGVQALLRQLPVSWWAEQPGFEQAAAHAGHAGVQQRKQGGRVGSAFAPQGLCQLQVAAGADGQVNQRVRALHLHPLHMRQAAALGVFGVSEQGGSGCMCVGQGVSAPGDQRCGLQLFQQFALTQARIKLKVRPNGKRPAAPTCGFESPQFLLKRGCHARAGQEFAGRNAVDPVAQLVLCALGQVHHALCDAQPSQATAVFVGLVHGQQNRLALVGQQFGVCQGAGCDHAHHFALDRAFGRGHIAHLLANGHRLAQFDEPSQVCFHRMKGHTGHHHRLSGRLAPASEGDIEQAGGFFCVGKEQLVKVAHAVEHQGIGKRRLDAQILLHHGGVTRVVGRVGRSGNVVWHQGLGRLQGRLPGSMGWGKVQRINEPQRMVC